MANKLSQKKLQNKFKKFCQILNKKNFQIFLSDKAKFVPPSKSRRIKYNSIFVCNFASNLFNAPGIKFAIKSAAHEVGHFLVISGQRRKRIDFGIPKFPRKFKYAEDYTRHYRKYLIEEAKAQLIEEAKAQLIDSEVMVILGINKNNYHFRQRSQTFIGFDFITDKENELVNLWWEKSGKKLTYKFMNA